jgi:hypothetical protein
VYREQAYVERCHCHEPAMGPCASCGRARCARHLEKGLCDRCVQFVRAEVERRSVRPWVSSTVVGVGVAMGMLVAGLASFTLLGLPIGVATHVAHRRLQRRRLIRQMGPGLSASVGELPAAPRETEKFPDAPPMRTPYG